MHPFSRPRPPHALVRSADRRAARSALSIALISVSSASQATCWRDPALTQQAAQLAGQLMTELQTLPQVLVCTPEHFPARADGLFNGGANQILVQPSAAGGPGIRNLLIHELAHALVQQQYGPQSFASGHGPEWMRLMVRLGQVEDARFHASVYPEALVGFHQAMASLGGSRPAWVATAPPQRVGAKAPAQTTLTAAESDLSGMTCSKVLLVPAQGGTHGYVLGSQFRSFTSLPLGSDRIRTIRWVKPGVLELDARPTADDSPSLMCLG